MKKLLIFMVAVAYISTILCGCGSKENEVVLSNDNQTSIAKQNKILVYVNGAVKKPGVYSLSEDARVYQAIEKAGGMKKNAMKTVLNLAETVVDAQVIHVQTKKEYKKSTTDNYSESSVSESGLININSASVSELTSLPGIGESKATAIVKYREDNGNFSSIEAIKNVSGIGDATYSNIESMITV